MKTILSPRRISFRLAAAGLLVMSHAALATDLVEAWQAVKSHDFDYMAAASEHASGAALEGEGRALWRPTVLVSGTAGRMSSNTSTDGAEFYGTGFPVTKGMSFNTSINDGNWERWSVSARQALVSRDRDAQSGKLKLAAQARELEWQIARQALILKTAERYFDVTMAAESLNVAKQEAQSIERSLGEIKSRFNLGDVPVTDIHEAMAKMEAIQAQILTFETSLQLKTAILADASGLNLEAIKTMQPLGALPPAGKNQEEWLNAATEGNPELHLARVQAEIAREELSRYGILSDVSVDLVGEVSHDRLKGEGDFGLADNVNHNALVGVQLTVPLYTGGAQGARHDEAAALAEKARNLTDRTHQQIMQQTRAAWLSVAVGDGRVASLEAALKASESRLAATRLGYQVGDRATLDVLNAESDAASARLALLDVRIALVMNRLRLFALAGRLDEEALKAVNAALADESNGGEAKSPH